MYVVDPVQQEAMLSELILVDSEHDGWSRRFRDKNSAIWTLYYPYAEVHGGGPAYLRRGQLPSDILELAKRVVDLLASGRKEDALGSAADLQARPETWGAILEALEGNVALLPKTSVETFLCTLGVLNGANRRSVLHKSMLQIKADAAFFEALTRKADNILQHVKTREA